MPNDDPEVMSQGISKPESAPSGETRRSVGRHVYSLTNPYTTQDEKVEIEVWYQLPLDLAAMAYIVTCLFWAHGDLAGWQAYAIAFGVGILAAVALWIVYVKRMALALKVLVGTPVVEWLVHLAFVLWFGLSGAWIQAALIACNRLLFLVPVGFGAVMANQILTSRYRMHPKFAFLKHVYGKVYPFE